MSKRITLSVSALLVLILCMALIIPGSADGSAPVAENFEFETYRGVSFGGQLSAIDPEGDTLSFEITTEPVKGSIELSDDGSFVYTPEDGKKGKDYFGYKAVDKEGNYSQEATVIIRILKQETAINYTDMEGSSAEYAAVRLAECGAYTGENLGGEYFFSPDDAVSRGEFLSLCLEVTDADVLNGVVSTGFFDDEKIPDWQKEYVSTGVRDGIVKGYSASEGAVFDSDSSITKAEAVAMLSRTLKLSDVSYINLNDSIPTWVEQDTANLYANDIVTNVSSMDIPLTRAEAAMMLSGAMDIK